MPSVVCFRFAIHKHKLITKLFHYYNIFQFTLPELPRRQLINLFIPHQYHIIKQVDEINLKISSTVTLRQCIWWVSQFRAILIHRQMWQLVIKYQGAALGSALQLSVWKGVVFWTLGSSSQTFRSIDTSVWKGSRTWNSGFHCAFCEHCGSFTRFMRHKQEHKFLIHVILKRKSNLCDLEK